MMMTLIYISIKILTVLSIYSFSYKFQLFTERRWLTIQPKHAEKRNLQRKPEEGIFHLSCVYV